MAKTKLALLFGGTSTEHEISCISAAAVACDYPRDKYELIKIGITKAGRWLLYPGGPEKMLDGTWASCPDNVPAILSPDKATRGIILNNNGKFDVIKIDVVFPALHGTDGEDGTVQGLLDLSGIPYVGCGVAASAMCMDKAIANFVFDAANIPHTPWLSFTQNDMQNSEKVCAEIEQKLQWPVFVKPASGGSSVGISKVKNAADLKKALHLAMSHCKKIVVEQAVNGSEIECAVMGNAGLGKCGVFCSTPGEIVSCNEELYDYEAKYLSGDASKSHIPAPYSKEKLEEVKNYAIKAYTALDCAGLARVDFFIDKTGKVLINELNTMPGFTPISMYPKLMNAEGTDFPELIDKLVICAKERFDVE